MKKKIDSSENNQKKRNEEHINISEENTIEESSPSGDESETSVSSAEGSNEFEDPSELILDANLREEIEQLKGEVLRGKDEILRGKAEQQNIRRRAEKDLENAHKFGQERFIKELLPVLDSMDKALEIAEKIDSKDIGMLEGLRMTRKVFIDTVAKFGVTVSDPLGEPFDPKVHQAISTQESEDAEPNRVLNVMQTGYIMHDRVLRPAMVVVSAKKNT